MNILDVQDKLKSLSEQQLMQEMQMPSGNAPQFLVLSEITRRKRMRDSMASQGNTGTTVAEEVVASAGVPQSGIASMAQALAPKSSIAQNTGASQMQGMPQEMSQEPAMGMYGGGYVRRMQDGGRIDTYLPGLSDEDRAKVMAAADARAGLHPLYMLVKAEAEARGVSPEAAMNAFFGQAAGSYGSPVDSGLYPAPAAAAGPEFLPDLTEEERQKVMLGADMRALGRRSYLAGQAEKQGVSPEALMGRYGLYETGLAPAPENPAGPQQLYRDELIASARGADTDGPYAYLFDQGGADMTSVNPSYTEDRPDRFPEEAKRLPISGYSLPLPSETTSYERRQNSELEQPRSWFRDQQKEIAAEINWLERLLEIDPSNRYAAERLRDLTGTEVQGMADGGYVQKMQAGGIIVRNGRQYKELEDGKFQDVVTGEILPVEPRDTYLPDLSGGARRAVMLTADRRAFAMRDPKIIEKAKKQGLSPEALISGSPFFNTNFYPAPVNPAEGGVVPASIAEAASPMIGRWEYGGDPGATLGGVDLDLTSTPQSAYEAMMQEAAGSPVGLTLAQLDELGSTPVMRLGGMSGPAGGPFTAGISRLSGTTSPYGSVTGLDISGVRGPAGGFISANAPVVAQASTTQSPITYDQIVENARNGIMPTTDQLVTGVESGVLNTQQALDVQAMIESGYIPDETEQRVASLAGMTPVTPDLYNPDTPYANVTSGIGDFFAGAFGGRTVGEQAEIDRQREEQAAEYRLAKEGMGDSTGGGQGTAGSPLTFGLEPIGVTTSEALGFGLPPVTAADLIRPQGVGASAGPSMGASLDGSVTDVSTPVVSGAVLDAGGAGGARGSGGAGVSAAPMTSYEQELINAMQRAEKRAEQDKWLALAQVGLGLMSSKEPTLGGAIGEAGAQGLGAFKTARDNYEQERLGLKKALYELQGQQAAALASQRRAGTKVSTGPSLSELERDLGMLTMEKKQFDPKTGMEETVIVPIDPADSATVAQLRALLSEGISRKYPAQM